jgi:hypothetical protein
MGMRKRNFAFMTVVAAGIFLSFAANSKKGSGWGSSNTTFPDRWNERFVVDTPSGSTSITVNNSSTTPSSTASDASYGSGTMTCRDTVAKVATDDTGSGSVSALTIPEIRHGGTASYSCGSFNPTISIGGMPVNGGTIDLKCSNGSLRVIASSCTAPEKPADPPPGGGADPGAGGGGGGGTTTPTEPVGNGCPAGNTFLTSNCGCCADGITTYTRYKTGGGKEGNTCKRATINFRTCTNGNIWYPSTGVCTASKPLAC